MQPSVCILDADFAKFAKPMTMFDKVVDLKFAGDVPCVLINSDLIKNAVSENAAADAINSFKTAAHG